MICFCSPAEQSLFVLITRHANQTQSTQRRPLIALDSSVQLSECLMSEWTVWFGLSGVFPVSDKLNVQVLFNIVLSDTGLLRVIQHSFIQNMGFLVQPLFPTKHQGLGKLAVRPGRSAAQSFVALAGEPPAQRPQVCKGGFP